MKHIIGIMAVVSVVTAAALTGTDSFGIGPNAGKDTEADRTTLIGPGSGAYATGSDSNVFIGAASGLRTSDVKSTVAIGHHSARGATNCTGCVFIGDLSGKLVQNAENSVLIGPLAFFGMDTHSYTDVNGLIRGSTYNVGANDFRYIEFGVRWPDMKDCENIPFNIAVSDALGITTELLGGMKDPFLVIRFYDSSCKLKVARIPLSGYISE